MSDEPQQKGFLIPEYTRPPIAPPKGSMDCIGSLKEHINKPAPKAFTWDNARDLAVIVRDGLLMIVKGFEKYFDLRRK